MRSCLICDDDDEMREALAFTVSGRWPQARILLAKSFPEAWRLAAREPLYLCLADLAMPGASERDGIARLRRATPAPILVVTGSHDDALLLDLIGSGGLI